MLPWEVCQGSHVDIVEEELQRYLKEGEINFRKEDPLVWWEKMSQCSIQIGKKISS